MTTSISGILTPGTVHGVYCSNSSAYVNVTGTIKGSNTSTNANGFLNGGGSATITATLLNGLKSPAWGVGGVSNYYTPRATDYVLFAKDSSYTIGTIDSHAVVMPTDPGVANVKLGTAYGSFTGTLAGGGGAYVFVQ